MEGSCPFSDSLSVLPRLLLDVEVIEDPGRRLPWSRSELGVALP
jgi:hypothetical protein